MSRLFDAEKGVYTGHEYHALGEQDLVDLRDKLEDDGDIIGCNTADEILRSRARQATRFHARRIIDRGRPGSSTTATLALRAYPTINSGHFSNLIGEVLEELGTYNGHLVTGARLLISRMTMADGAPTNHCIEVEFRTRGSWVVVSPRGAEL